VSRELTSWGAADGVSRVNIALLVLLAGAAWVGVVLQAQSMAMGGMGTSTRTTAADRGGAMGAASMPTAVGMAGTSDMEDAAMATPAPMSGGMGTDAVAAGGAMAAEPPALDLAALAAFVGAWAVMMAAMMLPSAIPMLVLYRQAARSESRRAATVLPNWLFVLGYLGLWAAVGVPIYLLSRLVESALAQRSDLADLAGYGVAVVLVLAGLYQFLPLKRRCLQECQRPRAFLDAHWRRGPLGALAMGIAYGLRCAGSSLGLMVALVAAGAMGLAWVAAIALVVLAEKLLPRSYLPAVLAGAALLGLGAAVAVHPGLATLIRG